MRYSIYAIYMLYIWHIAVYGYSTLAIYQFGWYYIAKVVYYQKKCYIAVTQGFR